MAEVDLIPYEFRRSQRRRESIKAWLSGYLLLLVLLLTAKLWLGSALRCEKREISTLQAEETALRQERQRLHELEKQRQLLLEHLGVLNFLRGGPRAEEMFVVIDRAINPAVWISGWKFLRTEEQVAGAPAPSNPAFTLLAKSESGADAQEEHKGPRMEISGQALSHSNLADFVATLQEQQEIAEVKLQNAIEKPYLSGHAIFYQMTLRVTSAQKSENGKSL